MSQVEQKIAELGFVLPTPAKPVAAYVPAVRSGSLVFVSGQGPLVDGKSVYTGRVGGELSEADGVKAAQIVALNLLAALKGEIGDLDRVVRIVKLLGWVNSAPGFNRQPFVINGASELFERVFGERGRHARSAVSAHVLPFDIAVEIELIAEVE